MMHRVVNWLEWIFRPQGAAAVAVLVGIAALIAGYMAEYVFGLQPCILCLYQRVPFAVAIVLGGAGFWFYRRGSLRAGHLLSILTALAFLGNATLAFYHVGVEQHWWQGFDGCSTPDFKGMTAEEMRQAIMNAPEVPCDEVPWSLFGISMAGYNVLLCAAMAVYMTGVLIFRRGPRR